MELKKAVIRAVSTDKCAFFVARLIFIDPFPVQPFVKGAAVVENAVQNDFHSTPVRFLDHPAEQLVARL